MSLPGAIEDFIVGRIAFPLTNHLYNRKGIVSRYSRLMKSEKYPQERLRAQQLEKARKIIRYAYDWVPFYGRQFKEAGLRPEDIRTLDDIRRIPPLTRQEVIDHHEDMVDRRLRSSVNAANRAKRGPGEPIPFALFRKHKLVRNTSSGSTGAPTIFYEDGSIAGANWANELRMKRWFGFGPGAREARMTRLATDYMPNNKTLLMRRLLWHQLVLPGTNMSDADCELCLDKMMKFRPRTLWGFTGALTFLADYILKSGKDTSGLRPGVAIAWAAPLYGHERSLLREAFECPASNIYGAREVGHVACMCPADSFHINQETALVEIERDNGARSDTEAGEILVTTLADTPMPFIRYRMGDLGAISDRPCSCGRSLQVLSDFLGRTGEVFRTRDGRMIPPNFWCRTFMDPTLSGAVRRFQVMYRKNKNITIRIVRNANYTQQTEAYFRQFLSRNFQSDTEIDFDYVPEIEAQISGKYQMVVSE